jgi:DNA mismatch repair protein MutS2
MLVDDALMKLACEIDRCLQYGERYLRVNHGKGQGLLRLNVRDMLGKHPHVARHFPARAEEGGDGVTVAELSV